MDTRVVIYNNQMKKQAILENAYSIGYEKRLNELWTAFFSLPADDPKNIYCTPLAYVEIFDQGERVELFRITPSVLEKTDTEVNTYQCEHVLATLIDDVLFQYHEIGGTGIFTTTAINYVLSKQTVTRWELGQNDFARQFLYKWENENLLGSLFSIPKPFLEDYMWTWDTTVYPWKINLVQISDQVQSYVRYKKNMQAIRREIDPTELCTRLYCLGYGEGVNQLTIKEVNNGLPYLDAATIGQFGVISRIFVDRRFEDAESLRDRGQALLAELQVPRITYEVDAADISNITNDPVDKFKVGTYTRVIDTDLDLNIKALIVSVSKDDLTGNPGSLTIQIANKQRDVASSIAQLADRQRINEVYAQGATNLDSHEFVDNCDPDNPAVLRFFIPEELVRINKMTLSYQTEPFRAFSRAIEGGGAFADTTAAGGAFADTTAGGGGVATSTASGGGVNTTSSSGGGVNTTSSSGGGTNATSDVQILRTGQSQDITVGNGLHNHGIADGTSLSLAGGGSVIFRESGQHVHVLYNHGHQVNVPDHTHNVSTPNHTHGVNLPNHTHGVNLPNHTHGLSIPNHTHGISLPNHTHQIQYGIFQGPMPTTLEVKVDGNLIPGLGLFETDINIIPYLSKDGGGRVLRGWHTIEIKPNNLGRVTATVIQQVFVQSRGGGNF